MVFFKMEYFRNLILTRENTNTYFNFYNSNVHLPSKIITNLYLYNK